MTTKTVVILSGTTWTPPADAFGAAAEIICWGAGDNGGAGFFSCCAAQGGPGGDSGCVASISSFTLPLSGTVAVQIPAAGSNSACWFSAPTIVSAASKSTSTAGCVGSRIVAGSPGGTGNSFLGSCCISSGTAGGGGGGARVKSTPYPAGGSGARRLPDAGGRSNT